MRLLVIIFLGVIFSVNVFNHCFALVAEKTSYHKLFSIQDIEIFQENSTKFSNSAQAILDKIIIELKNRKSSCNIEVYTCEDLQEIENWELSLMRANKILDYMVKKGKLSTENVFAIGYGKCLPLNKNQKSDRFANSNRIDFVILKNK